MSLLPSEGSDRSVTLVTTYIIRQVHMYKQKSASCCIMLCTCGLFMFLNASNITAIVMYRHPFPDYTSSVRVKVGLGLGLVRVWVYDRALHNTVR